MPLPGDSYSGSLGSSRGPREYFSCVGGGGPGPADPFDHAPSSALMQLPYQNTESRAPLSDGENVTDYGRDRHDRATPPQTFMGTFGKTPRRPKQEPPPSHPENQENQENAYMVPLDTDSERSDSGGSERPSSGSGSEGSGSGVYEQPLDALLTQRRELSLS